MRRLLLAITGLLVALLGALLLALRSEPFVLAAAHWAVATFTELRLELRRPRVDFYRGTLSADEIHLLPKSSSGPALLSVLDLSAHLSGPGGLFGASPGQSRLQAGSVLIYVSDSDKAADPKPEQWLGYLGWLPDRVRIEQVHLVTASANTWIFPLKAVRGDRIDISNYRLTAEADYDGEPLGAVVDLLAVDKGRGVTAAATRIELTAPASGSEFSLDGTLEGSADDFRYTFALTAYYRDVSEFLKGFEGGRDLAGELRLQGTMEGDTRGFVLSDASFLLINTPQYAFQASGGLAYRFDGATDIELEALGEMASLSYLVNWIDIDLADFGRAQSSLRLSGSLDKPVIDQFLLTTSNDAGLTVSMGGQLNLFEVDADAGPGNNALSLEMQGPSLGVLQRWLGELPFDTGPWRASGELTGDQENLSLRDIVVVTGTPDTLALRATGEVGRISPPQESQASYTFADILIAVEAHTGASAELGALLGRADIPPHQALNASLVVSGSGDELQLRDGELVVSASDLQATIGPLSAVLRPADTAPLSALRAPIRVELSDTAALSQYTSPYTDQPIPALGPLKITATLEQKGEFYQLLDVVGSVRENDLDIQARGRIGDLAGFNDVLLTGTIAGLDIRTTLATVLPEFRYGQSLGSLAGSFELAKNQGVWALSSLALVGGDDKTPLSFAVDGAVDDLTGLVAADIVSDFRLADPALLEALTGVALMPLSGSLSVSSSPEQIRATLKAQIGETHVDGNGEAVVGEAGIESLHLKIDTPHLHLQDFGFGQQPDSRQVHSQLDEQSDEQDAGQAAPGTPKQAADLLARLRDIAPPYPVDLSVTIDGLSGNNSNIDSLKVRVTGADNRYTLQEFSASYNEALAEIRGIVDLNPDPPAMSLAGQATALPLSAILADVGVSANVSGTLTILGGITVMGNDTDAMIRNLNGSVALALENAVIDGAAYDLLATDLLAWIYSGALTEKSTHLDCTMAKFQLRHGVATTDSLYIESARMVATGKAEFDLPRQKMDLRITPLSKSRILQVPSEVRLKGDISSPKADISPVSAVADATSAALMLIPSLTLKLFGVNQNSSASHRPCQAKLGN